MAEQVSKIGESSLGTGKGMPWGPTPSDPQLIQTGAGAIMPKPLKKGKALVGNQAGTEFFGSVEERDAAEAARAAQAAQAQQSADLATAEAGRQKEAMQGQQRASATEREFLSARKRKGRRIFESTTPGMGGY